MKSIGKNLASILVILAVAVFAIFAYENSKPVSIHFFNYNIDDAPLFLIAMGSFVFGVVLTGAFCLVEVIRLSSRSRRFEKQSRALEKQLHLMKQQPLLESFQGSGSFSHAGGGSTMSRSSTRITSENTVLDDDEPVEGQEDYHPHVR